MEGKPVGEMTFTEQQIIEIKKLSENVKGLEQLLNNALDSENEEDFRKLKSLTYTSTVQPNASKNTAADGMSEYMIEPYGHAWASPNADVQVRVKADSPLAAMEKMFPLISNILKLAYNDTVNIDHGVGGCPGHIKSQASRVPLRVLQTPYGIPQENAHVTFLEIEPGQSQHVYGPCFKITKV